MKLIQWGIAGAAVCSLALAASMGTLDADRYLGDIKYLASPAMKGRASGSPELEKAASWIAGRFKDAGLKTEMQAFPVTTDAKLGKGNQLHLTENGHTASLKCP